MFDYMCGKCGGLVPEPMKAYSYAGRYCHCATPTPPIGRTVTTSTTTPHREEHTEWEKEFDKKFEGYWRGEAIPDEIKFFIHSLLKDQRERIAEKIEKAKFTINVDEYLPMVENWDRKNFDVPFDHGYEQGKKDALRIIQEED